MLRDQTQRFEDARDEISASSAGGAPFLITFAISLFVCALLGFVLEPKTAALVLMFQGTVAMPAAFWLERRMGTGRMAGTNPLKPLSIQLAMSQMVGLPAAMIAYSYHPATVPAALAAIVGAHFLPYAWLQRSRVYAVLAVVVSLGAYVLTVWLKRESFPWVVMYMSATYAIAAPLVRANANRLLNRVAEGRAAFEGAR